MNLTRAALIAATLTVFSLPVYADPVVPDPGYGVRGGVVGTTYPTLGVDVGFIPMAPCANFGPIPGGFPANAFCQPYQIPDDDLDYGPIGVFSVDMLFNLFGGIPVPNTLLVVDPSSDFQSFQNIGAFLVRLTGSPLQCEETEFYESYESGNCQQLTAFLVPDVGTFFDPEKPPSVSIPGFNVPEPASMFLVATGLAAAAARRLRRKRER